MTKELSEAAATMGRKGGKARAKNLTKEKLSEIGRKAGLASAEKRRQQKIYEQPKQDNDKASA